jgi:hypothetical protein
MSYMHMSCGRLLFWSILLTSLLTVPVASAGDRPKVHHDARSAAAFFISGHSLTDNPYAEYLVQITNGFGIKSEYNQQILIGSPLRVRTRGNDPNSEDFSGYQLGKNRAGSGMDVRKELRTHKTIQSNQYDYLIITEGHTLVDVLIWEGTERYLRHYRDQFMATNDGHVYFFVPWLGIKNLQNINAWIAYEESAFKAWECVISKVNHHLIREKLSPVHMIPANVALVELVKRFVSKSVVEELNSRSDVERLSLLFSDDVHLTKLGVYYMALVTYASVFDSSPENAWFPHEITKRMALYLQKVSWEFVSQRLTKTPDLDLKSCGNFFFESFCNMYFTYVEKSHHTQGCRNQFSRQNKSSLFYSGDK